MHQGGKLGMTLEIIVFTPKKCPWHDPAFATKSGSHLCGMAGSFAVTDCLCDPAAAGEAIPASEILPGMDIN